MLLHRSIVLSSFLAAIKGIWLRSVGLSGEQESAPWGEKEAEDPSPIRAALGAAFGAGAAFGVAIASRRRRFDERVATTLATLSSRRRPAGGIVRGLGGAVLVCVIGRLPGAEKTTFAPSLQKATGPTTGAASRRRNDCLCLS